MAVLALCAVVWPLVSVLLGWIFNLLQSLVYQVFQVFPGSVKQALPPIQEGLLLDPAVVLAENIRTGKVKSETIVKTYVERIRAVNGILNAVVEDRFEAAMTEAKAADQYVLTCGKSPEQLALEKPFLGVPFTAKDAIAVKGLALTAGVVCRKGKKASEDCRVVALMRSAGAIPLCVTNVPELCTWWDASNNLYGVTNNPHDLSRSPGGSSGGEGALISSAGSVMGLGNDIGGSIRNPSFCCGIFGHKPTKRIVSNEGQFPTSHNTDLDEFNVTGPMCRYAADLAPMLKVMAGPNVQKLKRGNSIDLRDLKVYYTEDYINHPLVSPVENQLKLAVKKVVKHLQTAHGIKPVKVCVPHLDSVWSIWMTKTQTAQVPLSRPDMVTSEPGQFSLTKELLKCLVRRSDHTFNFLHLELLSEVQRSTKLKDLNQENHKKAEELVKFFDDLLADDGIFIFPSGARTAPFHQEQNLKLFNQAYLFLFNVLGLPVTQCPVGLSTEKLPLGVQIVANLYNDYLTLAVAREIENQFGGWKSPTRVRLA